MFGKLTAPFFMVPPYIPLTPPSETADTMPTVTGTQALTAILVAFVVCIFVAALSLAVCLLMERSR